MVWVESFKTANCRQAITLLSRLDKKFEDTFFAIAVDPAGGYMVICPADGMEKYRAFAKLLTF